MRFAKQFFKTIMNLFIEDWSLPSVKKLFIVTFFSGRSVVWLARLLWEQEAESSNLSVPTIYFPLLNLIRKHQAYGTFLMDQRRIYGISRWGDGLVGVLPNGNVGLHDPLSPGSASPVDLAGSDPKT